MVEQAATEVRRDSDGELCGYVVANGDDWIATTVFGGVLGEHQTRDDAIWHVSDSGLGSLAEHWTLVDTESGEEQPVLIQQADTSSITLALGYYSLPGVPTLTLSRGDLASGRWHLRRSLA